MLNGDAHHSEVEGELRISRCRFFKQSGRIIPEKPAPFHLMPSRRILYVGADLALLASLKGALKDRRVVRSPAGVARTLIESKIDYALLIFDGELSELSDFARALAHRQHTPVFTLPADNADTAEVVSAVACLLIKPRLFPSMKL